MSEALRVARLVADRYSTAVEGHDPAVLMGLYAPDVRVFDSWTRWSYDTADDWRQSVDAWLGSPGSSGQSATFTDLRATGGHDLIVVESFVRYGSGADEARETMDLRLTWAIARRHDEWVIIHEHTSAPVDSDSQQVTLERDANAHHPNS